MSREELVEALGTIARSGTRAFLDRLAAEDAGKEAANLIGQFGIGFYSSFMVADEVTVDTRRAGGSEAWRWTSDGAGAFTVAPLALTKRPRAARASRCISTRRLAIISILRASSASCANIPAPSPCRSTSSTSRARSPARRRRRGDLGQAQS